MICLKIELLIPDCHTNIPENLSFRLHRHSTTLPTHCYKFNKLTLKQHVYIPKLATFQSYRSFFSYYAEPSLQGRYCKVPSRTSCSLSHNLATVVMYSRPPLPLVLITRDTYNRFYCLHLVFSPFLLWFFKKY